MNFLKVNYYICPICIEVHESLSNYSTIICNKCVDSYGLTNKHDESMSIGFDRNKQFYNEVNGLIYRNKECYVRGYPCYINTENNIISIIGTTSIPKKIEKNKLKK
jgi:hypothetical protein